MIHSFEEYLKLSPDVKVIHYWDLPSGIYVGFKKMPSEIKMIGKSITIRKLVSQVNNDEEIEKMIRFIGRRRNLKKIKFPLYLDNINYVRLYSLMISEGSFRTEFSLHVPEEEFHEIFSNSIKGIFHVDVVTRGKSKGISRSRATPTIRHILPMPQHIPRFILENKNYSKEYLRIAFEAEGYPALSKSNNCNKRYIKLSRTVDISDLASDVKYREGERVFTKKLKEEYPDVIDKILDRPPITLLGEHFMLLQHFNIINTLKFEGLRVNKTSIRRGRISAKWNLYVYSESLEKFIKEINFITESKKKICQRMLNIKGRKRKLSSLELIKRISKNDAFTSKQFSDEMRKIGYVSPGAYLHRYENRGLIARIGYGKYRLLVS